MVPAARRLAQISYEEMQELAEAGAKVLNAQAVEFAKERGIALYARSTFGGAAETVVRRFPPRSPGWVAGVTSETGLVIAEIAAGQGAALASLLERLDEHGVGGKQLHLQDRDGSPLASIVLPLENLHDFAALRVALARDGVRLREGVGAVSAIGAGINASFRNVRTTLATLAELGAPVLGCLAPRAFASASCSKSGFVEDAVRRLHARLVEPRG